MKVHYLEYVTSDVEQICKQYAAIYGVSFRDPDPALGGARTMEMEGGGILGVRAPLREDELPVVRPYVLVKDIEAATAEAVKTGGELALPPMELPGHGVCAIVINAGIECGFWQL